MIKIFVFLWLVLCGLIFSGCNSYIVQDIIGKPTKHLDNYNKNFIVLVEYNPDYVYNKLKAYFYRNQSDIYKTYKTNEDFRIYVRNLAKIFRNVNTTTGLYLNISKDNNSEFAIIKIVSMNYELAEYFNDTIKNILIAEQQRDKEIEAKRLEEEEKEKAKAIAKAKEQEKKTELEDKEKE